MRCFGAITVATVRVLPPRLCPVPVLYSAACHHGAVSCHNPRPGGTRGRTWRLLGPTGGETVFIIQGPSSNRRGAF